MLLLASVLLPILTHFILDLKMDVTKHIQNLGAGYSQRHGPQFAREIALPLQILSASPNQRKLILQELTDSINRMNLQSICQSKFRDPNLSACVVAHVEVLVHIFSSDLPKGNFFILIRISFYGIVYLYFRHFWMYKCTLFIWDLVYTHTFLSLV